MIKPKSNARGRARKPAPSSTDAKPNTRAGSASPKISMRSGTKHARIIAMLRSSSGATLVAMMTATDWQQHSVRGFLAGVVRKKLRLNLVSEETDKGRVYRIKDRKVASVAHRTTQAA